MGIFVVQTVLADGFAVSSVPPAPLLPTLTPIPAQQTYRCYILWNRPWAAAIAALLVVCTLGKLFPTLEALFVRPDLVFPATCIGVLYNCAILHDGDVFAVTLAAWITTFFTLTLTTNVVCTSESHHSHSPSHY
jgi:hypothetical protein